MFSISRLLAAAAALYVLTTPHALLAQRFAALLDMPVELRHAPLVRPLDTDSTTVLRMAYASSVIQNPEAWSQVLRSQREVYRIDLIYTQYPVDTNRWITPFGKLTPARLKAIFALDPNLQDPNLKWNLIAQTDCRTAFQAQRFFHGVILWHRPRGGAVPAVNTKPDGAALAEVLRQEAARQAAEAEAAREKAAQEAEKARADTVPRRKSLAELHQPDELEDVGSDYMKHVRREMRIVRGIIAGQEPLEDSTVYHVFQSQPNWSNVLVVMDWTGSMYPYGAQLVRWHQENLEKGVVKYLSIFNDGDDRRGRDPMGGKPVGQTGGVYFLEPQHLDQIIATMETVMLNGDGGDLPENDLEAVLASVRQYPGASKVILIADRMSKVRDMPLLPQITVPVVIIPCGLTDEVHPDYLQIAWYTGGSILTTRQELHFTEARGKIKRNMVKLGGVRYEFDPITQQFGFSDKTRAFPWPRH